MLKDTIKKSGLQGAEARKAYKRAMKKVEEEGGYSRVLSEGLSGMTSEEDGSNSSLRERLREKINQQKMLRSGSKTNSKKRQKEDNQAQVQADEIVSGTKRKRNRPRNTENQKLNKLERKLGTVSVDTYNDSFNRLESGELKEDDVVYHQRVLRLYRRQQGVSAEKQESLDELFED